MANKKITALTQASGTIDRSTALMPYVQAGVTKKISIEQITGRYRESGTIPSADILAMGVTPFAAIPTPGPGYYLRIINCDAWLVFNTTVYSGGNAIILKHPSANKGVFSFPRILQNSNSVSGEMGVLQDLVLATDLMMVEDEALFFTTFGGTNPTLGDSGLKYVIDYEIRSVL